MDEKAKEHADAGHLTLEDVAVLAEFDDDPKGGGVAVSSTWGPDSLLGSSWQLLFELLDGLPAQEYAVRVTMHPAVWFGHGPRQILSWLRRYRQAGIRLVEPTSWRGLVMAADVIIGDHGSAAVYAAAMGVPTLHAPTPSAQQSLAPPPKCCPGSRRLSQPISHFPHRSTP
jgi:hypothetical protein